MKRIYKYRLSMALTTSVVFLLLFTLVHNNPPLKCAHLYQQKIKVGF